MKFLEEKLVALDIPAETPEAAIKAAGDLLVAGNLVESGYVEAMVESYRKNGPYFVLAPQIALPHARPEDGVKEASVAFVRLKDPVVFGSAANDPVSLVFALGASTSDEHLLVMKELVMLLNNPEKVERLKNINSYEELKIVLGRN
ncbi:PTS sugar transporter subunit IIA [Planococcus sp. NCCP-2050]|uniref:PTS sugar transporter subunit IIA n=1 Tax=Planococcus sp. NCCP-2050 TaxID=2944679 RepID=UPI00203ED77A|nr:PTS sugar transporter subunit IIA [Planococcus sp. NCCP-2050]GKW47086.1 PTS sugar transporter subunit IIA [Planococcus sp. NCCP-2050]